MFTPWREVRQWASCATLRQAAAVLGVSAPENVFKQNLNINVTYNVCAGTST